MQGLGTRNSKWKKVSLNVNSIAAVTYKFKQSFGRKFYPRELTRPHTSEVSRRLKMEFPLNERQSSNLSSITKYGWVEWCGKSNFKHHLNIAKKVKAYFLLMGIELQIL